MSSVLFVEAFGQLFQGADLERIVSEDAGDLYSVFEARAEAMCWSTAMVHYIRLAAARCCSGT